MRTRVAAVVAAGLGVVLVVTGIVLGIGAVSAPAAAPVTGAAVASPKLRTPPVVPVAQLSVAAAPPVRLLFPAVGLDVAIEPDATPVGGAVEPQYADRAYWLSAYGMPASSAGNTVYLAGHSSTWGSAVFDHLLDADREPLDLSGEQLVLVTAAGELTYRIIGPAVKHDKSSIADDPGVWEVRPGRLVLVTCDRHDKSLNIVFFAEIVGWRAGL